MSASAAAAIATKLLQKKPRNIPDADIFESSKIENGKDYLDGTERFLPDTSVWDKSCLEIFNPVLAGVHENDLWVKEYKLNHLE